MFIEATSVAIFVNSINTPNMSGKLYIVATPIGNLSDLSPRMKEAIEEADILAVEDTRRTGNLLNHFGTKKKMISLFKGNEKRRTEEVLEFLKQDQTVALISDAGTPLLSDPGFPLVRDAVEIGSEIIPIPGPSAILASLVASGLPADKFAFLGYPPEKSGRRKKWMEDLVKYDHTIVMFISPYKLFMLEELLEVLGDRPACLCRELTKLHEEFMRGKLSEIIERTKSKKPKGEYTLVLGQ